MFTSMPGFYLCPNDRGVIALSQVEDSQRPVAIGPIRMR